MAGITASIVMARSPIWASLWLGVVACGEATSRKPCGEGARELGGVCVGIFDCNVTETRTTWIVNCADGRVTVIDKPRSEEAGGTGGAAGAGGLGGDEGGVPGAQGGATGETTGGAAQAGTGGVGVPTGGTGGTEAGGGSSAGGTGEPDGGQSGAAGESVGGAGGAEDCQPGSVGCVCAINGTCEASLACRSSVCVAIPEPPTAVTEGHFELPPGPYDVVLDTDRNRLFASYGGDGLVRVLDLDDGAVTPIRTGHSAQHMYFDPVRDEVVIALATAAHSPYWFSETQDGYVAAIDALTLVAPTPIWIPLDPWQIVADGRGHAVASGGSGQWTHMISVDLETSWYALTYGPYDGTSIRIHPSRDRIYGADTGLSPSDIERYDLSQDGNVVSAYDSPYHGDYPMCGDLRIHPSGTTIYTPCGHIFLASNTRSADMTWVANMGMSWIDLGFESTGRYAFVLSANARALYVYDTETLSPGGALPVAPADRLLVGSDYLVLVRQANHGAVPYTDVEVLRLE